MNATFRLGRRPAAATIAAVLLLLALSPPAAGALSDCIDATCRITVPDGGRGTGCVFERSQGAVYVLTAAHVANGRAVQCEFWQQGHQSAPLPGQTILRVLNDTTDAAVIAVPESEFGGRYPTAIPLAPRGYAIQADQPLASVGCAGGAWATGWKGHVLGYEGTDLHFVPAPAQGRSGSALFDGGGERIVGIVRARTLDNQQGIATGTQALYGQLCRAVAERQTQCGPGGCGPNGCPAPQYRLLPYRQQQQQQQQMQNLQQQLNPWPTMPAPAAPALDMSPTNQRLDQLIAMLQRPQPSTPIPVPPPASAFDPLAQKALETAESLRTDVPKLVEEKLKPLADKLDETRRLLPLARIQDKLQEDAEEGGLKGRLAQRLLNHEMIFWTAAAVLGLGLLAAFGVLHLLRTGRGIGGELIDKIAASHPDNARLQDFAAKVDGIEDRIAARLRGGVAAVGMAAGSPAVGGAVAADAALHQLLAKLDSLHDKVDNNTTVSNQAAQAAAVAANK